nr:hypothetical protein BaRGS_025557 [Batillaria attramentaria]
MTSGHRYWQLSDGQCFAGWVQFESSCYGFGEDDVTWAGAESLCRIFDSVLAEVETAAENEFLKTMARNRSYSTLWIGGTDVFSEGYWIWAGSKQPLTFTDWAPGEPNHAGGDTNEDCLQLYAHKGLMWNDEDCRQTTRFVCELRWENVSYASLWLGGTDIFSEGYWIWAGSKEPITEFTDWFPGEPNHSGGSTNEDCLQLYGREKMQWNDEDCHLTTRFVFPEEELNTSAASNCPKDLQNCNGVMVVNSDSEFRISLDVQHFKPEEINIKTKDNRIIINAKHEELPDEHGFIMREFTRQYVLPKDVDPNTVTSALSRDGVLTVKAPKKALEAPKERPIPITHEPSA